MRKEVKIIAEAVDTKLGKTRVSMKRGGNHVAEAGQDQQHIDVIAGDRAAAVAVREEKQGIACRRIGEQRSFAAALHVGDRLALRQHIIGTRIGTGRRIADHDDVGNGAAREGAEETAVGRRGDGDR